jgi:hypothetical protein
MHTDTERLEEEIATLAVQMSAASARLLELIRRFDESGAWQAQGFRSCAHWLCWRIGLDLGAAREKVRGSDQTMLVRKDVGDDNMKF